MTTVADDSIPPHYSQSAGKSRPPLAKTVKLSADLVRLAELESEVAQRSTPKQIEYWSLLGRIVEQYLRKDQVHGLLAELKSISNITLDDIFPNADVVMAELEERRSNGKLSTSVTKASEVYDIVDGKDGLIRKRTTEGVEVFGKWRNGEFVEHQ